MYVQKRISQTQRSTQVTSARQVVLPRRLFVREDQVTSWCSELLHRTTSFFRTKSSFGSSQALFRRMEFHRTANIRGRKEYLGLLPCPSSLPYSRRASRVLFSFLADELLACALFTLPLNSRLSLTRSRRAQGYIFRSHELRNRARTRGRVGFFIESRARYRVAGKRNERTINQLIIEINNPGIMGKICNGNIR